MSLERVTIAERQGASEDQKFVAKPTQSNMNLFLANGIKHRLFENMTSTENLFDCWDYFKRGKRKREDVQVFERYLEDGIFAIQDDLVSLEYQHGLYEHFYVSDPKQRRISKASVRDRLVHQVVYSTLNDLFDKTFIFHSLSSRLEKGTHVGVTELHKMIRKVSRDSFMVQEGVGLPLGNVTSQLFANIYLHELDIFIKHTLRESCYLRYCDDFIINASSVLIRFKASNLLNLSRPARKASLEDREFAERGPLFDLIFWGTI